MSRYFTTKSCGSGLGLLIVRRIVREHGGEMAIESNEGKGLTLTIRLALSRQTRAHARSRRTSRPIQPIFFMNLRIFFFFVAIAGTVCGQTPPPIASPSPQPSSPAAADYDLRWGVKIPMRDKVELNATLYVPKSTSANLRTPAIFTLTPYISDTYHARAAYFASHGYAFALVDVRGRGNSGGEFEPFAQEPNDGHDVVEWLAQQSFCDGKVANVGRLLCRVRSMGTAKEFPPHLATIVPAAAAHPPLDYPSYFNIGEPYDTRWYTFTSGKASQANLFGDEKFWRTKFLEAYKKYIPFKTPRFFRRQSVSKFPTHSQASDGRLVLRRDGADQGAVSKNRRCRS